MDKDISQTSKLKLSAVPFSTETLFADEVQPVLHRLESYKKANKPIMSMSFFKETLNLTEDQATKPEAPISPQNKSSGPCFGKGRGKHFQSDSDTKLYCRDWSYWQPGSRQRHSNFSFLPKPNQTRKVLESVARSWCRALGDVHHKRRIQLELTEQQTPLGQHRNSKDGGQGCFGKSPQH